MILHDNFIYSYNFARINSICQSTGPPMTYPNLLQVLHLVSLVSTKIHCTKSKLLLHIMIRDQCSFPRVRRQPRELIPAKKLPT